MFAIRSGGVTGVLVKGPDHNINFRMDDKGSVISIKFSPDMNILAIQRTVTSVEFINYNNPTGTLDNVEYSQLCKGKNATILGFVWTHGNEILFVTDHGVELFQVGEICFIEQFNCKPLFAIITRFDLYRSFQTNVVSRL